MTIQQMLDKKFDELVKLVYKEIIKLYKQEYKKKKDYLLALFLMEEYDETGFKNNMNNTKLNKKLTDALEDTLTQWYEFVKQYYDVEIDINKPWIEGVSYKYRIYKWYNKLLEKIELELTTAKNKQEFEKDIAKLYDMFSKHLDTLVKTEMNHIEKEMLLLYCEENKIKKVKWVAVLDEHTCPTCVARNGRIYKLEEVPEDHPNGRCHLVPVEK